MRIPFLTKAASSRRTASKESRAAKPLAAAYYPDWSSDSFPPSKLDFSKFDILLFGKYYLSTELGLIADICALCSVCDPEFVEQDQL